MVLYCLNNFRMAIISEAVLKQKAAPEGSGLYLNVSNTN